MRRSTVVQRVTVGMKGATKELLVQYEIGASRPSLARLTVEIVKG